ncbi:MAG: membrane dipeptidase [Hyphomicrobiaceae bacterium]
MDQAAIVDCLQYANWSRDIFREMRAGGVHAVHVTIAYHETFREMVRNIEQWNGWFEAFPDLIFQGRTGEDISQAIQQNRTAIFFGIQNPSPLENDIGLVEICHTLGVRFIQLTYNNQSLCGSGWQEAHDGGISNFGREVICEMNRTGIAIDMSHAGERTTLEAIELSARPVAVTHANPRFWRNELRNVSDDVIAALAETKGMLGLSLYPNHLKGGSKCTLREFCEMVAKVADRHGPQMLGLGSDLCQGRADRIVQWMRDGRWKKVSPAEGQLGGATFPEPMEWFSSNKDFPGIAVGLGDVGFSTEEVRAIMGGNWWRFFNETFGNVTR